MTQKLTPEVVVQLNDLPGFPARPNTTPPAPDRWILGDWLVECHVNPEAPDFASLPLVDNRVGDVRVSLADQAWFIWDGAAWQPMAGGGGGGVNSVTASAPIASSGGINPNISLTGIVDATHGGTGLAAPGAAGNVLTSTGAAWASSALPASVTSVSGAAPIASSGGTTPTISLTGIVDATHGGTGIAASGAAGNVLTSNGAGGWVSSAPAATSPSAPLTSVQFNNGGSFGGSAALTWSGSTLAVDGAVDRATAGTLTVGGTTATAITVGKVGVTTTFPGPVNLQGDVTTVGGTQFTTDAQFDGNVTFGNAASDNISFVGQIDTAITQEGIAAPAVSPASTGRIYFDSGSNKFRVSQNGGAYVDMITGGTVTSITLNTSATGLTVNGGGTATITSSGTFTIDGTLDANNGGTGLTSPGAAGNVLTSDGAGNWTSAAPVTGITGSGASGELALWNGATTLTGKQPNPPFTNSGLLWEVVTTGGSNENRSRIIAIGGNTNTLRLQAGDGQFEGTPFCSTTDYLRNSSSNAQGSLFYSGNLPFPAASGTGADWFVGQADDAASQSKIVVWATNGTLPAATQERVAYRTFVAETVFNNPQNNVNFRAASQGNANMLFVDASANAVGIGTSTPAYPLTVSNSAAVGNPTIAQIINPSTTQDTYSGLSIVTGGSDTSVSANTRANIALYGGTNNTVASATDLHEYVLFETRSSAISPTTKWFRLGTRHDSTYDSFNLFSDAVDASAGGVMTWKRTGAVGIGTMTPSNKLDVVAGTLAVGQSALKTTGTLSAPSSGSYEIANYFITTPQGSTDGYVSSFYASLGTGYTGVGRTTGGVFDNTAEGTGTAAFTPLSGALKANFGGFDNAATTTGTSPTGAGVRVGTLGYSGGSSTLNVGVEGLSLGNAGEAVGVYGGAIRSSGSNNIVGGYFSLYTDAAPFSAALVNIDAALVADNGPQAASILVARDNGTATFTIADSGYVTAKNTSDSTTAFQVQNAAVSTVLDVDTFNSRVGVLTAAPVAALDLASGQLAIPDGSAAAPAVAFRDDLDTGIYSSTNGTLNITSNGSETARFYTSAGSAILQMDTSILLGNVNVADDTLQTAVVMVAHADQNLPMEGSAGGQFLGVRTRGTGAAPTAVGSGDGLWNALGAGYTSAAGYNYGALISFKAEQAYTATASGGRIEFHTTLNGTDGVATLGGSTTERMRITNDGKVFIAGVATTNTHTFNIGTAGTDPAFAIASGGRIHYYDGTATTNNQILLGDGSGSFAKSTLTAGTGISITTLAGATTIAATGAAASTSTDVTGYLAQEALNAGDLVRFVNDAGTPKVQKADATNTDARLNPVGFAVAAASAGAAVTVRVAGVADVPAARFDAAPAVTDVGKRVFVSTTSGQITITAPSASGDILQRAGVLVDGSGSPKVLVQIGDPTLL